MSGESACPLATQPAAELLHRISHNATASPDGGDTRQLDNPQDRDPSQAGYDHCMIWPKHPGNHDEVAKITTWLKANGEYGPDHLAKSGYENYKS